MTAAIEIEPDHMTPDDLAALRRAVQLLEHPGLAARLTNLVGKPIELIGHALPAPASQAIAAARRVAAPSPGVGHRIRRRRRRLRLGHAADRAPGFHRHHVAIDRRHRA